jgi:hypothetical protein
MQRHSFTALNSTFVVDSEYQFVKELGQGAYGCVVGAKHRRTGDGCAIKKITNINTKVCGLSRAIPSGPMRPRGLILSSRRVARAFLADAISIYVEDPHEEMSTGDQVWPFSH